MQFNLEIDVLVGEFTQTIKRYIIMMVMYIVEGKNADVMTIPGIMIGKTK